MDQQLSTLFRHHRPAISSMTMRLILRMRTTIIGKDLLDYTLDLFVSAIQKYA